MLQNKHEENKENINIHNNLNSNDNAKQDIKNIDKNSKRDSSSNSKENNIINKNDEIINNLLNNANKDDELQFKIDQLNDVNSFENVKQDIINFYLIEKIKSKEKKKEIETNKNGHYNINSKNSLNSKTNYKNNRPHSVKKYQKKNRFEKYDKEKLSYEVYHQYQKLNFNNGSIPFLQRMELYSLKKCLKDYKIEELTNLKSPKISEKEIVQTFNRLIEDSNRRLFKTKKTLKQKDRSETDINIKNNDNKKMNNLKHINKKANNKPKKCFTKKKWDEIYEKRFESKLKERNEKLEKMRKEKEEKIKKEEDTIIDNLNKQQELYSQRYGMKRNKSANNLTKPSMHSLNNNKYYIGNSKIVTNLNQRLYYNEINKKDIDYLSFKEKARELINNNEKNDGNKKTKENNNNKNYFRKAKKVIKNKNIQKNSPVYNFIDFEEKNEKEEEKNNNNFDNIIKDIKNDIDLRISETSIVNNSNNFKIEISGAESINNKGRNESAEKIIDRFFEN